MERLGQGLRALVIGSSGGIGSALQSALASTPQIAEVTGLSRSGDGLDVTDETAVAHAAGRLSGEFQVIVVASGGLNVGEHGPEKTIRDVGADGLHTLFALNAVGPALCLKHFHDFLPRDRPSFFGVLSARVGSVEDNRLGGWTSYRAAKAAVNQIIHTTAIEIARKRPQAVVAALHPGTVQTDLTAKYLGRHKSVTPAEAAENLVRVMGELTPSDTGGFYDWRGDRVPW
ncbi:MAG: SDR family NAD(P)-dependent oxidoreductase [Pseudomonadota bacterium]